MVLIALFANPEPSRLADEGQYITSAVRGQRGTTDSRIKQRQVRLTAARIDQLVADYRAGSSVQDLVDKFGIHRTTALDHLERRGVPRRRNTRKLTDEQVQQAAAFYEEGDSLVTTGARFGVDGATIAREFKRAGFEVRPRR